VASFDSQTEYLDEPDWRLLQNSHVHLYWQDEVLTETVKALADFGYRVFAFDAHDWQTDQHMLVALGRALSFPDYYGRNLDALNDCLSDVATYGYGAAPADRGTLMAVRRYDSFTERSPRTAQALLDIFATQARHGALVGHRMLMLVQTTDPRASYSPVGATPVIWNPKEWLNARRGL
jgi:hypothetical protein